IAIEGEGVKGIAAINLALSFDPSVLNIIEANSGNLTKSFSLEKRNLEGGSINLVLNCNKGILEESGELIRLRLAINSSQTLSTYLHFDSAKVQDENTCSLNILNLKDGQIKITTGVDKMDNNIPSSYFLSQNYPNPFNPSTKFRYEIPAENKVLIKIYDILGREVATLVNDYQKAGSYQVEWNAGKFASGVYFYSIKAGDFSAVKKLLLLK
ncbi:MAG TPA: T9SS type A sorting domain-containing protein, partial [Ignavibacteriaceae bacterium]|nr:T9SS type A sorting domain-containing protein [Ignavibacteriaceae bacterium]